MASETVSRTTRATLSGFALVGVLLAVLTGAGTDPAGAATLEPCQATNPTGPIVDLDGRLTLAPTARTRKVWKRSGIRQGLIAPASGLTGEPTFPVRAVKYGTSARVDLKGGLKVIRKNRTLQVRNLTARVPSGKPATLSASIAGRTVNFARVKGGKRTFDAATGELNRSGGARLTAAGAKLLNRRLGLAGKKRLRAGMAWGNFDLFALYKVTEVEDPTGEVPVVPPVKMEPSGALTVLSAATVKWFVRDSFINYVATGEGTRVEDGATADPPSGPDNLSYSFNFPFASGWTVPGVGESPEDSLIKGSGTVGFRYCHNTINFTASDPEIELDGDEDSRLIFDVNGTDGTPFPDQRAVMVKLIPSKAAAHSETDNGNGTTTVSYTKIPGYIPAEATGIFAGFYSAFDPTYVTEPQPACGGVPCTESTRPDRFGFLSVTYTHLNAGTR